MYLIYVECYRNILRFAFEIERENNWYSFIKNTRAWLSIKVIKIVETAYTEVHI